MFFLQGRDFNIVIGYFSFLIASLGSPFLRALEHSELSEEDKGLINLKHRQPFVSGINPWLGRSLKCRKSHFPRLGRGCCLAGTEIVLAQAGISHSGSGVGAGSHGRASLRTSGRCIPSPDKNMLEIQMRVGH